MTAQPSSNQGYVPRTYDQVVAIINETLTGREDGHEILPEEHESMARAILDYARSTQTSGSCPLMGFADTKTVPQVTNAMRCFYVSLVGNNQTMTFSNFRDNLGNSIEVDTDEFEIKIVILMWNTSYWEAMETSLDFADLIRLNIENS